jgi:hypothetical protein
MKSFNMILLFFIVIQFSYSLNTDETTEKKEDCSSLKVLNNKLLRQIRSLQKKIANLTQENKELKEFKDNIIRKEEEKRREKEKKEEEEKRKEKERIKEEEKIFRNLNTKIITKREEIGLLINRLKQDKNFNNSKIDFKLLYRGSEDGKSAHDFHRKCDGVKKTISIIKTDNGAIFGGYAENAWTENAFDWVMDDLNSFVFSLSLMKIYNSTKQHNQKYHMGTYSGPQFYGYTVSDYTGYTVSDHKPFGSESQVLGRNDDINKHFSGFTQNNELNLGKSYYYISEIEVFQVINKA